MEKRIMDWAYWLGLLFAALAILLRIANGFNLLLGLANVFGGITPSALMRGSVLLLLVSIAIAQQRK
ncbi:MAG TPA: hypothetical protein VIH17_09285 [Candidatus Acidoferrales bacterium]